MFFLKLAVTYQNGEVFQHFGHTEFFKIYEIENGSVISSSVVSTGGNGHGALSGFLKAQGVTVVICGGIGGGAQNALVNAGIRFFGGVKGDCDKAVQAFLEEKLSYNPNVTCNHHGEGHTCSGHSCGNHDCH